MAFNKFQSFVLGEVQNIYGAVLGEVQSSHGGTFIWMIIYCGNVLMRVLLECLFIYTFRMLMIDQPSF